MDDSLKSIPQSNSSSLVHSITARGDPSIERLAPVSVKGSERINKVFHELIDSWKGYTDIEDGDRIAAILQNFSVEKQLEQIEAMEKDDIINVVRFNLRKTSSLQEENEELTRRNREISEKLHRVEHRVGKAQVNVFDKVQKATMQILTDFHERELTLARRNEELEAANSELRSKNSNLEATVEKLELKVEGLEAKNRQLTEQKEENEERLAQMTKRIESQSNENFHLTEQLENAKATAMEKSEEALQEAMEVQRLKTAIVKERDVANSRAVQHQQNLQQDVDKYRMELERTLENHRRKYQSEIDALNEDHLKTIQTKEATIQEMYISLQEHKQKIANYERNFAMTEARIKGDVKRSLAANYQEMLNIVSSGPSRPPPPISYNPLLDLARELETNDKENSKKRESDRSNCPSPKRTIGTQAKTRVVNRPLPVQQAASSRRLPSTSSSHRK